MGEGARTDADLEHFHPAARTELDSRVSRYRQDLRAEAARLEAAQRSSRGPPEIVSSMIVDADLLLRRGYKRPKKSGWIIAAHLGSYLAIAVLGAATNHLDTRVGQIAFAVSLAVGMLLGTLTLVKE